MTSVYRLAMNEFANLGLMGLEGCQFLCFPNPDNQEDIRIT